MSYANGCSLRAPHFQRSQSFSQMQRACCEIRSLKARQKTPYVEDDDAAGNKAVFHPLQPLLQSTVRKTKAAMQQIGIHICAQPLLQRTVQKTKAAMQQKAASLLYG